MSEGINERLKGNNMSIKDPMTMLEHVEANQYLITSEQLQAQMTSYFILDIRQDSDTSDALPSAHCCHWYKVHTLVKTNKLPKDQPIAVVCYTGQSSMHVALLLNQLGYQAYSLLDGMEKWPKK